METYLLTTHKIIKKLRKKYTIFRKLSAHVQSNLTNEYFIGLHILTVSIEILFIIMIIVSHYWSEVQIGSRDLSRLLRGYVVTPDLWSQAVEYTSLQLVCRSSFVAHDINTLFTNRPLANWLVRYYHNTYI